MPVVAYNVLTKKFKLILDNIMKKGTVIRPFSVLFLHWVTLINEKF